LQAFPIRMPPSPRIRIPFLPAGTLLLVIVLLGTLESPLLSSLHGSEPQLILPTVSNGSPGPGRRVALKAPEYGQTEVHHMLYLPPDWKPGKTYPVIVEYTGNHFPTSGSTGKIEDAGLGFGITGGRFIWLTLPFVGTEGLQNTNRWWGDIEATVDYAKRNIPRICRDFGGDPDKVLLCGFSRGAIATNFIGLHDDEIAGLWCGFITHDHFDGQKPWPRTDWGSPLEHYRKGAAIRLARVKGRPYLVCQNGDTSRIMEYIASEISLVGFTFLDVDTRKLMGGFPNALAIHPHNDRWLMVPSSERDRVWNWVRSVADTSINP